MDEIKIKSIYRNKHWIFKFNFLSPDFILENWQISMAKCQYEWKIQKRIDIGYILCCTFLNGSVEGREIV